MVVLVGGSLSVLLANATDGTRFLYTRDTVMYGRTDGIAQELASQRSVGVLRIGSEPDRSKLSDTTYVEATWSGYRHALGWKHGATTILKSTEDVSSRLIDIEFVGGSARFLWLEGLLLPDGFDSRSSRPEHGTTSVHARFEILDLHGSWAYRPENTQDAGTNTLGPVVLRDPMNLINVAGTLARELSEDGRLVRSKAELLTLVEAPVYLARYLAPEQPRAALLGNARDAFIDRVRSIQQIEIRSTFDMRSWPTGDRSFIELPAELAAALRDAPDRRPEVETADSENLEVVTFADGSPVPAITRTLRDPDSGLQRAAAYALAVEAEGARNRLVAAVSTLSAASTAGDPVVQILAAKALGGIGAKAESSLEQLQIPSQSRDPLVRQAAKEAVERIQTAVRASDRERLLEESGGTRDRSDAP